MLVAMPIRVLPLFFVAAPWETPPQVWETLFLFAPFTQLTFFVGNITGCFAFSGRQFLV